MKVKGKKQFIDYVIWLGSVVLFNVALRVGEKLLKLLPSSLWNLGFWLPWVFGLLCVGIAFFLTDLLRRH